MKNQYMRSIYDSKYIKRANRGAWIPLLGILLLSVADKRTRFNHVVYQIGCWVLALMSLGCTMNMYLGN